MKNFIWDFDGTLYDTYPVMMDALMQALNDFRFETERESIYRTIKMESIRHLVKKLDLPEEDFNRVFHQYENRILTDSFPFEDTKETLWELKEKGGQHFILTHRTVDSTWQLLQRDGMQDTITAIIGSDSGYPRKPDPTSLNALIDKYNLNKEETVMIGDRKLDMKAGRNAQVATCFYDIDHFNQKVSADWTIHHLKEITSLFPR